MKIYFNNCFTRTKTIIDLLQNNENGERFEIYISHESTNQILKDAADYYELEPIGLDDKEYAEYCLDFCSKHRIDIFIPRYRFETLVKYKSAFDDLGVKTMFVCPEASYEILNDKMKTASALMDGSVALVPRTFLIDSYESYTKHYAEIVANGRKACMKPVCGIGGDGFKKIAEDVSEVEELYSNYSFCISKERLDRVLRKAGTVKPFLLQELMEGIEYSIDCLADNGNLIIGVPRRKINRNYQNIEGIPELIEIAATLTRHFNLSYIYNIQVKYHDGKIYLLEINTRMSAGAYKACFTGVNMPYLAVQIARGEKVTLPENIQWHLQIFTDNAITVTPI